MRGKVFCLLEFSRRGGDRTHDRLLVTQEVGGGVESRRSLFLHPEKRGALYEQGRSGSRKSATRTL